MTTDRLAALAFVGLVATITAWRVATCHADSPEYVTVQGVSVYDGGGTVPAQDELSPYIGEIMRSWRVVDGYAAERIAERVRGSRLYIREVPFWDGPRGPLSGLTRPSSKRIDVGMDQRGPYYSALAHELGHLISGLNELGLKEISAQYGLRY